MRSSRVTLLLGALLAICLLFSVVNGHAGHHHDDLEAEDIETAAEATPAKVVELPTFTVLCLSVELI